MQTYAGALDSQKQPIVSKTDDMDYMIVSGLRGGKAKNMACDPNTRHLKLIPLGSVAACLSRRTFSFDSKGHDLTELFPPLPGQAFCFLPLPVQTKLPVHVNAYWELSSNRRDIWKGEDTQGEAKLRSDWNGHVMEDVLAPLYANLLLKMNSLIAEGDGSSAKNDGHSRHQVLDLLPCPIPAEPWNQLAKALFSCVQEEKILWSNLNGGCYVSIRDAVLLETYPKDNVDDDDNVKLAHEMDKLEQMLLEENLAVARVQKTVMQPMVEIGVGTAVTPDLVRKHFSNNTNRSRAKAGLLAGSHPTLQDMEKVIFLLRYCFKDITMNNFSLLDGLPLVPLENNELGTFLLSDGDEKSEKSESEEERLRNTLYLVNTTERLLLKNAGNSIVKHLATRCPQVFNSIKDSKFGQVMNIKTLDSADFMRLLSTFVPSLWLTDEKLLIDRTGVISNEWLTSLWGYIIEKNAIERFVGEDKFPVLPVLAPSDMKKGEYVVKISEKAPVLHMQYSNASPAVINGLADIGIYIFDRNVLGSLSYSTEIGKFLSNPGPRGVLNAFSSLAHIVKEASSLRDRWGVELRRAMAYFVLDEILLKIDKKEISPADVAVLCDLPIWERHGYSNTDGADTGQVGCIGTGNIEAFSSIDTEAANPVVLPPDGVEDKLLGQGFLRVRTDRDRAALKLLGVSDSSKGSFYATYLIPSIERGDFNDSYVDGVVVELLKNLPQLETDHPGLTDLVKVSALIRSRDGKLCVPESLYDPKAPHLLALLPLSLFPNENTFSERSLLLSLRTVGLKTSVDGRGILLAATSIQNDFYALNESGSDQRRDFQNDGIAVPGSSGGAIDLITKRGAELLRYLELNLEDLLAEVDAEGLAALQTGGEKKANANANANTNGSNEHLSTEDGTEEPRDMQLGADWARELQSKIWIPVYTSPPVKTGIGADGLPWPEELHDVPLAAPKQCISVSDTWMASSTRRVCAFDVKTDMLREVLGWNDRPSGRQSAAQLVNIQASYAKNAGPHIPHANNQSPIANNCNAIFPRLMASLQEAMSYEDPDVVNIWVQQLASKPAIWIGGHFVEPSRLAFKPLDRQTEPYLYQVSGELLVYRDLLKAIGVKEQFGPVDLAAMMRSLRSNHQTAMDKDLPLSSPQVQLCVFILKLLVKLINENNGVKGDDDSEDGNESGEKEEKKGKEDKIKEGKEDTNVGKSEEDAANKGKQAEEVADKKGEEPEREFITIDDLRPIYLPDRNNVLMSSSVLTYDDAPWISTALEGKGNSIRLVHRDLGPEDSKILGAMSLREQLFSGDEVVCPEAGALRKVCELYIFIFYVWKAISLCHCCHIPYVVVY